MEYLTSGYTKDIDQIVGNALFKEGGNEMVIIRDIELFRSANITCFHSTARPTSPTFRTAESSVFPKFHGSSMLMPAGSKCRNG